LSFALVFGEQTHEKFSQIAEEYIGKVAPHETNGQGWHQSILLFVFFDKLIKKIDFSEPFGNYITCN
jgi:hypothetical protein